MTTTTLSFDHLLPEGQAALPFQTVGVAYATVAKRCFISDEQGLGKTLQALLTLEANTAFPAVVIAKASLKDNWANEIRKFLPHRTVAVVSGRRPYEVEADIVVVNYDVLDAWANDLAQPLALVADESHLLKNPKAKRTQAARRLAESVPAEGYVLLLTGTPLLNRPIELISQLQILGRLNDVAPQPRKGDDEKAYEYSFKFAFCGPKKDGNYWDFSGASNLDQLNDRLRSTCYVRRLRNEVLGMNDTRAITVPLSLNGALDTYRKAEENLISFLSKQAADAARLAALEAQDEDPEVAAEIAALRAAEKADRAYVLVELNTLRRLAGEAKIEASVEWIKDFFEQNPGKSLVVFAHHKAVQAALIEALAEFNPAQILAGQADVEAQKARFQAKETPIIVCSIEAAQVGHTLTAASDVLFIEQPWTPGAVSQAEDRVNRIGQDAEQCFSWHLLAAGTIDEHVSQIIANKRVIVRAAADGVALANNEGDVASELLANFARKASV